MIAKFRFLATAASLYWLGTCAAHAQDFAARYVFLTGNYVVVGQRSGSDETYSGRLSLTRSTDGLSVVRSIGGRSTIGTGTLEEALNGETTVLRVRFAEGTKRFEATYLIGADLDNYARLTGYVYLKDDSTKRVGLEALFADFGQLKRN